MIAVLDASAVLTLLYREDGHEAVAELVDGALISAVNWSEVALRRGPTWTPASRSGASAGSEIVQ